MMMVREQVRKEIRKEGKKEMEGQIDYKKAYEESVVKYKEKNSLISQIMSISTEQIRIGRELSKTVRLLNEGTHSIGFLQSSISLLEKSYTYNEKMKYDFMVAYCDELWRELRHGLQKIEESKAGRKEVHELDQLLIGMRHYLVTVKNSLRRDDGWDNSVIATLTELKAEFEKFEASVETSNSQSIDMKALENYREVNRYFMDAYFIGLILGSQLRELRV